MTETLNIAQVCPGTYALGPGRRFVIWVQGCPFNCKGCVAPDWIPIKPANLVSVRALARQIRGAGELEGITISGGEPMLQAAGLARLLSEVKEDNPGLSVIAFSGFTLAQLREKAVSVPGIRAFLGHLDVLIDGLYIQALNDGRGLRGSANQKIHFLTERYREAEQEFEWGPRKVEFHLLSRELLMVGIPSQRALKALRLMAADASRLMPDR